MVSSSLSILFFIIGKNPFFSEEESPSKSEEQWTVAREGILREYLSKSGLTFELTEFLDLRSIEKLGYATRAYPNFSGGSGEDRTHGQLVKSQMLYH